MIGIDEVMSNTGHIIPGIVIRTGGMSIVTTPDLVVEIENNGDRVRLNQQEFMELLRMSGFVLHHSYD